MENNILENYKLIEKIKLDELRKNTEEWGYDALCMRFEQIVNELVHYKALSSDAKESGHYGDFKFYKNWYARHCVRFYNELKTLLEQVKENK